MSERGEKRSWLGRLLGRGEEQRPEKPAPAAEPAAPPAAPPPPEPETGVDAPVVADVEARIEEPVPEPERPVEEAQAERPPETPPEPEPEPPPAAAALETPASADRVADEEDEDDGRGWLGRLRHGLGRSSSKLTSGIAGLFTRRKLDDEALEQLEELLITADLGVETAARMTAALARSRFDQMVTAEEVREALAVEIAKTLEPVARTITIRDDAKPHVILVCGVNGSGKTTTIAKFANLFRAVGYKVFLAAGDTFRAAAIEQLQIWGARIGVPVLTRPQGADAASLAYDAFQIAKAENADVLIIDTAGRLHNKAGLMEELRKMVRVLRRFDPNAPHDCLLVLDATVGQNAHSQVQVFREMVDVTGLAVTKLDGTARGGVVVALAERFKLPVYAIGVGEGMNDMRSFEAKVFARSLLGLDD